MTEVADLFVVLRGISSEFTASMAEAGAASEKADGKIAGVMATAGKMALGFGVAAVAVGVEGVRMASKFDQQMEQLHTLAGVPQQAIAGLGSSVLKLAGTVATGPDSLAEALYHVESSFASTGITGPKAMQLLTIAAEGAKVGNADLVDVTNALDAAVVSGIPGVQNYSTAMGSLLTIVGSGDMSMQDLANAFSTGLLAIGKQYGATLTDIGAGLAVFGDNNIRGQNAATDMRMAIMDLTKQAAPGQKALEGIGIASGQLGKDLQTGGMNKALTDLHSHLLAAGDGGVKMGAVLEDAFTKKSSAPLAVLLGQFDRLQSKYKEIGKGGDSFGDAWQKTSQLMSTRIASIKASLEAGMIGIGHALTPLANEMLGGVIKGFAWLSAHRQDFADFGDRVVSVFAAIHAAVQTFVAGFQGDMDAGVVVEYGAKIYQFGAIARRVFQDVVSDVKAVVSFVEGHKTLFESIAVGIGAAAAAWVVWTAAVAVWEGVMGAATAVMGAFNTVLAFAAANPIMLVIVALIALGAGLVFAYKHSQTFRAVVQDALHAVASAAQWLVGIWNTVWKAVASALTWFVNGPLKFVQDHLKVFADFFHAHGQEILQIAREVWTAIADVVKIEWDVISALFKAYISLLETEWRIAWDVISTTVKIAWDVVSAILKVGLSTVSSMWKIAWDLVVNVLKIAWGLVHDSVKLSVDLVLDVIGVFLDLMTGHWSKAWKSLKKLVSDAFTDIKKLLTDFSSGALTLLYDVGRDIIQGMINGIKSLGSAAKDAVVGVAKDAYNGAKSFFHIGSPSKLMADDVGQWIPAGIAQGILDNAGVVDKAMSNIGANVKQFGVNGTASIAASVTGGPGSFAGASGIASAAGGGSTYVLQLTVQGSVVTETELTQLMYANLLKLSRITGKGAALLNGRRG